MFTVRTWVGRRRRKSQAKPRPLLQGFGRGYIGASKSPKLGNARHVERCRIPARRLG